MPLHLITGIVVGLLGSYFDDLVGASSAGVTAVQVVLWIAAAVLIVQALRSAVTTSPAAHRGGPVASR